jgi:hypothetical protein
MIVVHEVRITVVDTLVIRHMRERRMDAYALGDDFRQRTARADQVVINLAGAYLVAHDAALFKLVVKGVRRAAIPPEVGLIIHRRILRNTFCGGSLRLEFRPRQPCPVSRGADVRCQWHMTKPQKHETRPDIHPGGPRDAGLDQTRVRRTALNPNRPVASNDSETGSGTAGGSCGGLAIVALNENEAPSPTVSVSV